MVFVSDKDLQKALGIGDTREMYSGKGYEPAGTSFDELDDQEKQWIKDYNNPKNEQAFKKSRDIFNKILDDPDNKDYEKAKEIAPYIKGLDYNDKDVKYKDNAFIRGLDKVGEFTEEANKAFLGGAIEDAAKAVNFVGSGFNSDEADKRTADFMDTAGLKDKVTGLSSLESAGMNDEQKREEMARNMTDSAAIWGKRFGEGERIATDIATTVIPAAGAEKLIRGLSYFDRLSKAGKVGKIGSEVVANVGSGFAATGTGAVKDPTSLTPENLGVNTGVDLAVGLLSGGASTTLRTIRNAKNSAELSTALAGAKDLNIPAEDMAKLNRLTENGVKKKNFNAEVQKVIDNAEKTKKLNVMADGATSANTHLTTRLDDIDRRLSEVDSPEYQKNNGLMNTDAAEAKYQELMSDPSKIPGVQDTTKALQEAEQQVKYYDDIRMTSPYARQVDSIRNDIDNIQQSRQSDLENLQQMAQEDGLDPDSIKQFADDANKRYDDMIKSKQDELSELAAKNPEADSELQVMDQAQEQVQTARMDAQQKLDDLMKNHEANARAEAQKIADTPNEEAVQQHKQLLEEKKNKLNQRIEFAQKRYESDNTSLVDVDDEINTFKDGSHPLLNDGSSKEKVFTRLKELNEQKAQFESKRISHIDPEIPKTPAEQEAMITPALEEVMTAKGSRWAKIGRSLQQPANQLRAAGLNKLADLRTDAIIAFNRQAYDNQGLVHEWGKLAKGKDNSSKRLFRAANGDKTAYDALTPGGRKVVDEWQAQRRVLGEKMGLPKELLDKDYYIPHLFVDKVKQPKLLDIQMKIKKLQDSIDAGGLDDAAVKRTESQIAKYGKQIDEVVGDDNLAKYYDFVQENGNYSNRFLKERTGAEGYEENFWKATDSYMNAANIKTNLEPTMQAFAAAKQLTPEKGMQKFLQGEIDKMRGTKADIDRNWDNALDEMLKISKFAPKNSATKSLRGFRYATSMSHIGFSANSAINTLAQVAIMPGSINLDGSMYGMYKALQQSGRLAKNAITKSDNVEFKQMQRMGVFEGSSHILPEQTLSRYGNKFNKLAFSGIIGSDRFLRMATYHGAMLKAERMGLKGNDLERYVYERVNEVNQNFSKLETPQAFRSQVAKTLGSLITFAPGMIVRSAEIGGKTIKGAADIIGHTAKGDITRAQFLKDVDDISKGLFTMMAIGSVGAGIGAITGQDEVVPSPFESSLYSSPALQFIFGSDYKTGLMGAFTSQTGDEYDENGNNISRADRTNEFMWGVLPSFLVPGYSQGKRTLDAKKVNESGFSTTEKGDIRYMADHNYDMQRLIFGQYSTPEGREYIDSLGHPGGGSLPSSDSDKIKAAPEGLQRTYYDYFKASDAITGRSAANKEVTKLFKDGRPEAARRKAAEFNAKVDEKMAPFFENSPYIDDELKDDLRSNVYITLTDRSESARTRSKD